jgi:hypothetical protein
LPGLDGDRVLLEPRGNAVGYCATEDLLRAVSDGCPVARRLETEGEDDIPDPNR